MLSWMRLRSARENLERSVLLGMYRHNKPFVSSLLPRCRGLEVGPYKFSSVTASSNIGSVSPRGFSGFLGRRLQAGLSEVFGFSVS